MTNYNESENLKDRISIIIPTGRYDLWFRTTTPDLLRGKSTVLGGMMHRHTMFDVHCATAGSYFLLLEDRQIRIGGDTVAILPPNTLHSSADDPKSAVPCRRANFKFTFIRRETAADDMASGSAFGSASGDALAQLFAATDGPVILPDSFSCISTLQRISQEAAGKDFCYYQFCQALVLAMICSLGRQLSRHQKNGEPVRGYESTYQKEMIEEFFGSQVTRRCTQDDLSSLLKISNRQLNRVMNSLYGMSFRDKLMQGRHERAKQLLLSPEDLSLSSVAEQSGYSSISSLCHAFVKLEKISPDAYRKRELKKRQKNP